MMQEVGHCPGIENYSRPLSGKRPGEPPDTLYDFFPDDFLLLVDESHVTFLKCAPCMQGIGAAKRRLSSTVFDYRARSTIVDEIRRMGSEDQSSHLRLGDSGEYELKSTGGESRRTDYSTNRIARSGNRGSAARGR